MAHWWKRQISRSVYTPPSAFFCSILLKTKYLVEFTTAAEILEQCSPVSHVYLYLYMDCFLGLWLVCMCTQTFNESRISTSPHSANTPSRFWEAWSSPSSAPVSKYSRMSFRFIVLYPIWMGWVCRQSHVQPAAAGHGTDVTSWIRPTESAAKLD